MSTLEGIVRDGLMPPAPTVQACATALRARFGAGTAAVLFYGGALRAPERAALLDFYVLVDDLACLTHPLARLGAAILPPNVYMICVDGPDGALRCKVAVMTFAAFQRGMTAFAPHLWARFAQPICVAFVREERRENLITTLATAVRTTLRATRPLLDGPATAQTLWTRALTESYGAELRPERRSRAAEIVAADAAHYEGLMVAALREDIFAETGTRERAKLLWWARRRWGKPLNALRLMKAAFTFTGGLDYAVAKIVRHSGVAVTVRDADRKIPLLGGIRIFLEARRRGGVR